MASAENKPGLVTRGLEAWQKVNKITLPIGVAAGVVGIAAGMPWLATLGFGSALIDATQILIIDQVKDKKNPQAA